MVASTYASQAAGTPLASNGVPPGSLPVGVRVQDDKRSYVRLAGTATVLGLTEDPAGGRSNSGPAAVQACQITTSSWKDGEAIAMADAPAVDSAKCVQGKRSATGVWLFDLSSFPSRTDARGFALVPGDGAGVDFQVAFKR